jgi:CHRD domain
VRLRLVFLAVLAAAIVPVVALGASSSTSKLTAAMVGSTEVPKGAPKGHATATVTITGAKVCWKFTNVTGIDKTTAAHIHKGKPGTAGPVVVPFGAAYKPSGCIASTAAVVKGILANPAGYYVNIHTVKFPGGAVRGQLKKPTSSTY